MSDIKTKTKKKPAAKKRALSVPRHKSFKLSKRVKHAAKPLPSAYKIFKSAVKHLYMNKKVFAGITGVYLLLTIALVKGLGSAVDVPELKLVLSEILGGGTGELAAGITLFGVLVGNAGAAASEAGGAYQTIVLLIVSLALIWALRQTFAEKSVTTKQAFYKGLHPFVPYVVVLVIIGLQVLPLGIGSFLANLLSSGFAVTPLEQMLWAILIFLLAVLSLYMLASSLFAMYIVSLPDMEPLKALRTARELVRYRRWAVLRKVLFLPFALLVLGAFIVLPVIFFLTPFAEWFFLVLSMLALAVVHAYLYTLYREML